MTDKNKPKKQPAISTKATFSFTAAGVPPLNRIFTFNIEAKDEEEAKKLLAADLGKIINDLTMDAI